MTEQIYSPGDVVVCASEQGLTGYGLVILSTLAKVGDDDNLIVFTAKTLRSTSAYTLFRIPKKRVRPVDDSELGSKVAQEIIYKWGAWAESMLRIPKAKMDELNVAQPGSDHDIPMRDVLPK